MNKTGIALFLIIALSVWALMHAYVFWHAASVPWVAAHVAPRRLFVAAALLWALYPVARMLNSHHVQALGVTLEFAGTTWIGFLFLAFSAVLATDVCTLGGLAFPRVAPVLRGWSLAAAGVLGLVALTQGLRPPAIRDYEVRIAHLPGERDGLTLVAISDMHLGTLLGERWLTHLITRVDELQPDLVVVVGDLVDGNADDVETLVPTLKKLRAPLGVWSVTGNHEYYAGVERSVAVLEAAGYNVLRNRWAEAAPGLIVAGVDDLTAGRQFGLGDRPIETALADHPPGAVVLLSHTPWQADRAAELGAGLMLSGHTHGGQIWPFNHLVRLEYPFLSGRHEVGGMTLLVSKGAGTWGPRMRLWGRGEILRIRLRSGA